MGGVGRGQSRSVSVKIVLFGPPWSGKTTTLRALHARLPAEGRGPIEVARGATGSELSFESWPRERVRVGDRSLRLRLSAVPGEWESECDDAGVLADASGVIFVADSSPGQLRRNVEWFMRMERTLLEQGRDLASFPLVMAWNKRDRPQALPAAVLQERLNRYRYEAPAFPMVATAGRGVLLCLQVATWMVAEELVVRLEGRPAGRPPVR